MVGIVEEFFKYLAVRLTVYRSEQFNEVMDGMVYMVSPHWVLQPQKMWDICWDLVTRWISRAILSYLAHISFFGDPRILHGEGKDRRKKNWILVGFIFAVLFTGSIIHSSF